MTLSKIEIAWIGNKLNNYDIKYQEIYDELKDHLISSVETRRDYGDAREIELVFNEVMQAQFPGFWPFDQIVKEYQSAYRKKISKAMRAGFLYYLNWKSLLLLVILVIMGFYLPHNKPVHVIMIIALLLVGYMPMVYGFINGNRIKTDKGKRSLLKSYVLFQCNALALILNIIFNLLGPLGRESKQLSFLNPTHWPLSVLMMTFGLFCIYGLGAIRLTRQELNLLKV